MTFLKSTKSKLVATLIVLSFGSIIYLYFQTKPSPFVKAPSWKNIQVGRDSKSEVIQKLGTQPVSATVSATGKEILNFSSEHDFWPDQVYIDSVSQKSNLIKERVLGTNAGELASFITTYGQPEAILASNDDLPALGFRLHLWPAAGVAVNAHPNNGAVFEVWYFPPTTLEKFQLDFVSEITVWVQPETF